MASRGLKDVKDKMQKWSGRSWAYMLVHQGDFEEEINECSTIISDYLVTFMVNNLSSTWICP